MSASDELNASTGLRVAVTGPTGEIGLPFITALEQVPEVASVVAMARRPFDPAAYGWEKTSYRQGDILDRDSVEALVEGADVVVHLAFIVLAASAKSFEINIEGSRNVFEATAGAGAARLIYTSSVAAYGYGHPDGTRLDEDTPAAGTESHHYSHQKAEVERVLGEALAGAVTEAYVFRPCVVAGPRSQALIEFIPYLQLAEKVPMRIRDALGRLPFVAPVLPDHGIRIQLVHHDDVAAAMIAGVLGSGPPGIYNLAAEGEITISDIAGALGWHALPIPAAAVELTAEALARAPLDVPAAGWLEAARSTTLMDTARARDRLGWEPRYDAAATLREMVTARG